MTYKAKALEAWGDPPPWVMTLAAACDQTSQNRVAQQLDMNSGYVSYALRNQRIEYHLIVEEAVRARLLCETVSCPVLGDETNLNACRTLRRGVERFGNSPMQRAASRHCPSCPHNIKGAKE